MASTVSLRQPSSVSTPAAGFPACYHCGLPCPPVLVSSGDKPFCCNGCKTVYELLEEHGLGHFYDLEQNPGVQLPDIPREEAFEYLNAPSVRQGLLDFTDGKYSRVTFHLPAMHCVACVWLLENLFRLRPGIGRSRVNFPQKEVSITYEESRISLGQVAALLASLGYEPLLNLSDLEAKRTDPSTRRLYLQLGIAGFAFGNIMLMSLPSYFGLAGTSGPAFHTFFGWTSLLLALPVLLYSASDYWKAALLGIEKKVLTIDFPIAMGLAALFGQSLYEVASGAGQGYLDSFAGLVFFLLCGRVFQRKTYDALSFDRDYKSYFPLSVLRKTGQTVETVSLTDLCPGDRILIRNRELIPADGILLSGDGCIDYSFVTGESVPEAKAPGDYVYAGGRQVGTAIEMEVCKEVSRGYLTSLWNDEAFKSEDHKSITNMTDRVSRYFTAAVVVLALGAALYWYLHEPGLAVRVLASVLIVACPCALALSAPFAFGTATRLLGRAGLFLRDTSVVERLTGISSVIFDKTGTLTLRERNDVTFHGKELDPDELSNVVALAGHSTHPHSIGICRAYSDVPAPHSVEKFCEEPGSGLAGRVRGRDVVMGSPAWLERNGVPAPDLPAAGHGAHVHLACDGTYRGYFALVSRYRSELGTVVQGLDRAQELVVLTGDHDGEAPRLRKLFGERAWLRFRQSPQDKLTYVRELQRAGRSILMVGDGLNDAGALKQSNVGIAVSEDLATFSPACDAILDAGKFANLSKVIGFARSARRVVVVSFVLSFLYNVIGISLAAQGLLSPLLAAILMPVSSISVVAFAVLATTWVAHRAKLEVA